MCFMFTVDLISIHENLSSVKYKIIVLSGKGGVGKSTIATLLSFVLASSNPDQQVRSKAK